VAIGGWWEVEPLREPQGIAVGIVHLELARAPALIDRTFVNRPRRIRIAHRGRAIQIAGPSGGIGRRDSR